MEAEIVDLCKHTRIKSECCTCMRYCSHGVNKGDCRVCNPHAFCTHGKLGYSRKRLCKVCKGDGKRKLSNVNSDDIDEFDDPNDAEYTPRRSRLRSEQKNQIFTSSVPTDLVLMVPTVSMVSMDDARSHPVTLTYTDDYSDDLRPISDMLPTFYFENYTGRIAKIYY